MVQYHPIGYAAPKPPVLCPKCGSHRTEIVGSSPDGATVIVRCNICGERSEIANPQHEAVAEEELSDLFADAPAGPSGGWTSAWVLRGFIIGGDFRRRIRAGWLRA